MKLPRVWAEPFFGYIDQTLKKEAARLYRIHQLPTEAEEWKLRRQALRDRIWQALGVRRETGDGLDYRETGSIRMDGYSVRNIYFRSQEDFYITGNLYVPEGAGPFPGVVCLHGHWSQGRLAERVQSRGHTLAKNGYVCLAVDAFGSGERGLEHGQYEYHGGMLGASLMNIGETLMGIHLIDNIRAVDLLSSLNFVQADKIGVTGASGGGNQTMWLAAMDDRIAASVPVASVGTFESYIGGSNCVCETLPDGLTFMEESSVLALAAPNAMKICSCLGEIYGAFVPAEMLRAYGEARKVYQALGAGERFSYQVFNLPHGYWPEMREAMLGWFDLHLRGIGHGGPREETPFQCLPEKDLMVFPEGCRDEKVVSIAAYCRRKGKTFRARVGTITACSEKDQVKELAGILRMGPPLRRKALHRYSPADGWTRWALETECGRMVPLLVKEPVSSQNYHLLAGATGKGDLVETSVFAEAAAAGDGIALIDLWGTGETEDFDTACGFAYHNLSRSCLWLGRTLLGEWVRDFSLADSVLRESFAAEQIKLAGHKEAGLAALFCAVLSGQPQPVVMEDSPVSYVFNHEKARSETSKSFFSMALHLPGIVAWGDIPLAMSLARGDVRVLRPRRSDGELVAEPTIP